MWDRGINRVTSLGLINIGFSLTRLYMQRGYWRFVQPHANENPIILLYRSVITECICLGSRRESVLRRMPHDLTNEISASAQAMVWCCEAPKHYQSQRRSRSMSPIWCYQATMSWIRNTWRSFHSANQAVPVFISQDSSRWPLGWHLLIQGIPREWIDVRTVWC